MASECIHSSKPFHEVTSFLATLPLPAFVKTDKGALLYLNPKAEKLWRVKSKEVSGKALSEVLGWSERELRANDLKVLKHSAALLFVHVGSTARSSLQSMLEFPMVDTDGRRLLGGIVMQGE